MKRTSLESEYNIRLIDTKDIYLRLVRLERYVTLSNTIHAGIVRRQCITLALELFIGS